jgi:hypothetical protein
LRPALRKYAGSRANNSTHTAPPTFRKRRCSELRLCQIAGKFARIRCAGSPRIPFLPRAHGRDLEADCPCYCGQKNEPRCGIDTRARGSGHGYYLLLRKALLRGTDNFQAAQRSRTAVRRWGILTGWFCRRLGACGRGRRHPWHLCSASDRAHQLAVCLFSLRSYYLS